jgi:hypothetical protein
MSSVPPPSQSGVPSSGGNNVTYILLAVVLLLGIGGIAMWKLGSKPDVAPPPRPTVVASVASSAPSNPLIDEVPLPPPIVDAAPQTTHVYSGNAGDPCLVSACNGNVASGSDTERGLQVLALQTRRKCYNPALANDPTLQGHVKVHMKIASTGQVCSAAVSANDMSNTSVGDCAARVLMSSGRVPPPSGGCVNLDFPLAYVPMGQH